MMPGFVYFIADVTNNGHGIGRVKIGYSQDPYTRARQIQRAHPERVLIPFADIPGSLEHERALHRRFADGHLGGEWFDANTPGLETFMYAVDHFDNFHTPDLCAPAPCEQCRAVLDFYCEVGA